MRDCLKSAMRKISKDREMLLPAVKEKESANNILLYLMASKTNSPKIKCSQKWIPEEQCRNRL